MSIGINSLVIVELPEVAGVRKGVVAVWKARQPKRRVHVKKNLGD